MPVFAYRGIDTRGKPVSGSKDADSPKGLRQALKQAGITVLDVQEARGKAAAGAGKGRGPALGKATPAKGGSDGKSALRKDIDFGAIFGGVKKAEVAAMTRQLSTLLRAGIPLAEALGILSEQIDSPRFKQVVADVRQRVNEGSSLADAMSRHPNAFEDVFVSMVRAGETAGNLDTVLDRLADFMEASQKLRSKVQSALIYPAVMVAVSGLIMGVLMVAVVPQITQLFADNDKTLPWNTRLLVWSSSAIANFWWLFLLLGIGAFFGFRAWTRSPGGRPVWDRAKLKLPVIGPLARMVAVARFTRTLGTMLASGVPLLKSLDVAKDLLDNWVLMKVIEGAREQIQQGESIAGTLKKSGEFPSLVTHMIAVGERAGQLEQMLGNVATNFESEADMKLGRLTALLEPLIIVVMGLSVAFVVFSILMPIMEMNQFAQ
jgi:general secretion pathway protein F